MIERRLQSPSRKPGTQQQKHKQQKKKGPQQHKQNDKGNTPKKKMKPSSSGSGSSNTKRDNVVKSIKGNASESGDSSIELSMEEESTPHATSSTSTSSTSVGSSSKTTAQPLTVISLSSDSSAGGASMPSSSDSILDYQLLPPTTTPSNPTNNTNANSSKKMKRAQFIEETETNSDTNNNDNSNKKPRMTTTATITTMAPASSTSASASSKNQTTSSATSFVSSYIKEGYTYTPLNQISAGMSNVNVYGVVTNYTTPKPSQGTDFSCTVTIMDPALFDSSSSYGGGDAFGLKINIFMPSLDKLPKITRLGQIFRAHRLKIGAFNGGVLGVSIHGSDFMVVNPEDIDLDDDDETVLKKLHQTFNSGTKKKTLTLGDARRLKELKQFSDKLIRHPRAATTPQFKRRLCDIQMNTFFDLICKVVSDVREIDGASGARCNIWDGTHLALQT
eukprot:GEZU01026777.1.p2 GENE.GEZU01026777.1~~GEZU01026777.1.p2  ORF type:complete len:447 (+),score=99.34 GEZU01026777.1:2264-3604(+)